MAAKAKKILGTYTNDIFSSFTKKHVNMLFYDSARENSYRKITNLQLAAYLKWFLSPASLKVLREFAEEFFFRKPLGDFRFVGFLAKADGFCQIRTQRKS